MLHSKAEFEAYPPAGFSGQFHWDFLKGCFPRGIMPCDIDGVVEMGCRMLCWETKKPGVDVPVGQKRAIVNHIKIGRGRISYLLHEKTADDIESPIYLYACEWDPECVTARVPVVIYQASGCGFQAVADLCKLWGVRADVDRALSPGDLSDCGFLHQRTISGKC